MTKLVQNDIASLTNEQSALAALNANYALLENFSDTVLSRDGTTPNQMMADLDMNSHILLNVGGIVSGSNLSVGNGTVQHIFSTYPINSPGVEIASGTVVSPITTAGPTVRISRTENIAASVAGGNPVDNECNAGLVVTSIGAAATGMQACGILGQAQGSGGVDVVGGSFIGRMIGSGTALAAGIYTEGRRDTNTPKALGIEVRSSNNTATAGTYNAGAISDTSGVWVTATGVDSGAGVVIGNAGAKFKVGFGAVSGSVADTTFRDDTNSTTSIQINGTHTTQIAGTGFVVDGAGTVKTLGHITAQATGVDVTGIQPGDVGAVRSVNTGVYYFGSNGSQFLFFDAAKYQLTGGALSLFSGTSIPAGGTAGSGYLFSSTTNFGVFFGSGAPSLSAAKGSLYLRSDGSGTTDRAYINTNGTTTWTALTTAA